MPCTVTYYYSLRENNFKISRTSLSGYTCMWHHHSSAMISPFKWHMTSTFLWYDINIYILWNQHSTTMKSTLKLVQNHHSNDTTKFYSNHAENVRFTHFKKSQNTKGHNWCQEKKLWVYYESWNVNQDNYKVEKFSHWKRHLWMVQGNWGIETNTDSSKKCHNEPPS